MSNRFGIIDLTLDLLSKIVGYLDQDDCQSFALVNGWHLLVYKTVMEWSTGNGGTSVTPAVNVKYIDRPRFLRPGEGKDCVALVSYPRSGNSMLRGLLERVTGIVTGSDTRPDRVLSRSLLRKGLKGEGVVDERAWVVKTHWPERYGYKRFTAHRIILLVRNPFDAINSYFNMGLTNTHEKTLTDDLYVSLGNIWEEMVRNEMKIWSKFNHYWLTLGVPVLAIRYEDLLLHTEEMLVRLCSFLERLDPDAVRSSPTHMERIKTAAEAAKKAGSKNGKGASHGATSDVLSSNKPRAGGKIGASLRYYSPAQIQEICKLEGRSLRAFGYDPESQDFPNRLLSMPPYERCIKHVDAIDATTVANKGRQIRNANDKYGRSITKIRHELTDHDRVPLPTVSTSSAVARVDEDKS